MKPPELIKKGLKYCVIHGFSSCHPECPYFHDGNYCKTKMHSDTSEYITQLESDNESKQKRIEELESRLAQVERERDAAVADLEKYKGCGTCKFQDVQFECDDYQSCAECDNADCPCYGISVDNCWQWRGVCEGGNT